jgi:hypothetical protein
MELIVAGVGPDGRSAIVQRETLLDLAVVAQEAAAQPRRDRARKSVNLWKTTDVPPKVERPATEAAVRTASLTSGGGETVWNLMYMAADTDGAVHRTDMLSYNVVVAGHIDLILETERVRLNQGDCLVCLGVMHGWETGDEDALLSCACIGLDPA